MGSDLINEKLIARLGKLIKAIREFYDISLEEIGKSIGEDPAMLSRIENGESAIETKKILEIILKLSILRRKTAKNQNRRKNLNKKGAF